MGRKGQYNKLLLYVDPANMNYTQAPSGVQEKHFPFILLHSTSGNVPLSPYPVILFFTQLQFF